MYAIAEAVIKAIGDKLSVSGRIIEQGKSNVIGDGFDNKSGECYPPEKTWNNVTKRKMIYHRQFDN
jgi:hypothetical protein